MLLFLMPFAPIQLGPSGSETCLSSCLYCFAKSHQLSRPRRALLLDFHPTTLKHSPREEEEEEEEDREESNNDKCHPLLQFAREVKFLTDPNSGDASTSMSISAPISSVCSLNRNSTHLFLVCCRSVQKVGSCKS